MKYRKFLCYGLCLTLLVNLHAVAQEKKKNHSQKDIEFWITKADRSSLLSKASIQYSKEKAQSVSIEVDPKKTLQEIDGFGYALTGGSAMLLHQMSSSARAALLKELFLTDNNNIGVSYLRISVGASDLDDHVFSYAPEKFDENGNGFSLDEDRKHLIPVLKEILAIVPSIKIMASPWSAPPWMKTNENAKGGTLKPEYYEAYARYFVKYIQEMKKEGIVIDAVTLQNEPEHPGNTPSMLMTAEDEANFVKNNLGPAFKGVGIKTKIIVFDHNCDHPQYPIAVLNDVKANPFIDGSAFHMYLGDISAMSTVHDAHPEKNIYFTEQWTSGKGDFGGDLMWHIKNLIIGGTRNWAKTVIEWNLAADSNFNPHTSSGGCTICQGALTIDGDNVARNVSYYIIAQASKFIPTGSKRIASNFVEDIPNVAFITPSGKKALIVLNEGENDKTFTVSDGVKSFNVSLSGRSTGTLIWE